MAFVALVLLHPFQAINCRSDDVGWWRLPPNGLAWGALRTRRTLKEIEELRREAASPLIVPGRGGLGTGDFGGPGSGSIRMP
jgi:hypothetical protein